MRASGQFTPQLLDPQQLLMRGWVGPRASLEELDNIKMSCTYQDLNSISSSPQQSLYRLCYPTLLGLFLIASILEAVSSIDSSHSCRTSILNHLPTVRRISGKLSLVLLSSRFTFKTYRDTQRQNLHLQGHISEVEYIIQIE